MSYVPAQRGGPLPIMPTTDSWDRAVTYQPPRGPYDPRWLINGTRDESGAKLTGLFDEGSFVETLGGWATSVVTGSRSSRRYPRRCDCGRDTNTRARRSR